MDLLWSDASTGLTTGPGEGEMKQKGLIRLEKAADGQSILAVELTP